jgi:hypothetical protein
MMMPWIGLAIVGTTTPTTIDLADARLEASRLGM